MNNLNHVLTSPSHEQFEQAKIQRCILTHGKNENNIMFKWEILIVFVTFQNSSSSIGDTVTWVKVGKLIQWGMFYMFQVWVKLNSILKKCFFCFLFVVPGMQKRKFINEEELKGIRLKDKCAIWSCSLTYFHTSSSWYIKLSVIFVGSHSKGRD